MAKGQGHVYITGAGPGDPGLITVAGARAIAGADAILHDALASPALLRGARPDADIRYVGKRAGAHALSQGQIEELMIRLAREGKSVVRLKGGDPFVFGRGSEEALACARAGVAFTVIPGVTSAIAAPAYAGIPLTHRGLANSFMVVTGSGAGAESDAAGAVNWKAAAGAGTLAILMGAATLGEIMSELMAAGKAPTTPAACVRWGTHPDQTVLTGTVGDIAARAAEARLESPIVTVVGPVVELSREIAWFRPGPLAGKRVVVTRARGQASALATLIEELGASVMEVPAIRIEPRTPNEPLREAIRARPGWVVFASANAVRACLGELFAAGLDARAFGGSQLAAIGPGTAEALAEAGLRADFTATRPGAASLAASLPAIAGQRILIPASALAGDGLAKALCERGALVEQVTVYDTRKVPLDEEQRREAASADAITFTSASTARNLRDGLGETALAPGTRLVSIGPQTSEAVRACFGRLDAEAARADLPSLTEALKEVLAWD